MTAPTNAPTLHTARLILRGPQEDDFDAVARFMASDRARFVGGPAADVWQAWRGFLGAVGHWALRGYGFFTLVERDTGHLAGRVGVIFHPFWQEPELGWHLFDGFEGKGYAHEAAQAVRDWAWQDHGLGPLISYVHPGNLPSRRLAERLGARHEADGTLLGVTCMIYRHPDPGTAAPSAERS